MVSAEVQRTLVKSPPELWSELGDPAALARHLGEFGEIRITRVEPEKTVEWEAEKTSGTVTIKPSGWGTKVTLSVARELTPAPEPSATEESPIEAPLTEEPSLAVEPATSEQPSLPEQPSLLEEPSLPGELAAIEESSAIESPPESRRGFFARLFGRRRAKATSVEQPEPDPPDPRPSAVAPSELALEPSEPAPEPLEADETAREIALEEVTAALTAVLDRLGAAHHRPFSRS